MKSNYAKAIQSIFILLRMFESEMFEKHIEIFIPILKTKKRCYEIDYVSNMICFKYKTSFLKGLERVLLNSEFFRDTNPCKENKTKLPKNLEKKIFQDIQQQVCDRYSKNIHYTPPNIYRGVFCREAIHIKLKNTYDIQTYLPEIGRDFRILLRPQGLGQKNTYVYVTISIIED